MKSRVVGLTGYATVGKDTAAQGLVGRGWRVMAFADPVRSGVLALNPIVSYRRSGFLWLSWKPVRLKELVGDVGWTKAKRNPEVRRLLQRYGTEAGREVHGPDCWVQIARRMIDQCLESAPGVVLTDVRFPNEVELIRSVYAGKVFLVRRDGVGPCGTHASERLDFPVDGTITNNGTPDHLQKKLVNGMRAFGYAV